MSDKITICGLGKMGSQIAARLHAKGFDVNGFDPISTTVDQVKQSGIFATTNLEEVIGMHRSSPRIFWIMIPHESVDEFILHDQNLGHYLAAGDIVIDGGNSFYEDSMRRANTLHEKGVTFFDCGTSGGPGGGQAGFSLMIGGSQAQWQIVEPIFAALAYTDGYARVGDSGAGHFTKMVHNGIEYGMMEAIGEGYAVLDASPFNLNLSDVSRVYQNGSVIRSWLIDLAREVFDEGGVGQTKGIIDATGEGQWTVDVAKKLGIETPVIADALAVRAASHNPEKQNAFSNKLVALLRKKFGGHATHE